jgi:hypothetical protein
VQALYRLGVISEHLPAKVGASPTTLLDDEVHGYEQRGEHNGYPRADFVPSWDNFRYVGHFSSISRMRSSL